MIFKTKKSFFLILFLIIFFAPLFVYAIEPYVPIEEIPLVGRQTEITNYLKGIFQFGVAAIAIVSMLAIMIGGYLYIFSGGSEGIKRAKTMIFNALLGLGLALVSWIIVYTINPDLIELKGIRSAKIDIKGSGGAVNNSATGGGTLTDFVAGTPPPDFTAGDSAKCLIREAKWEPSSAYIGETAQLVFNMPTECVNDQNITNISISAVIKKVDAGGMQGPTTDIETKSFSKASGQLIPDSQHPFILKAKWELPLPKTNNPCKLEICEGDKLTFVAQSIYTIKNVTGAKQSDSQTSINNLEVLSASKATVCEITKREVKWANGARFTKDSSGALQSVSATLNIGVTPGCNFQDEKLGYKYALSTKFFKSSIYTRNDILIFAPKIINFPSPSDNIVKIPFVLDARNLTDIKYNKTDYFLGRVIVVDSRNTARQIFSTYVESNSLSERTVK